jgi:hypothetical protein
MLNSDPTSACYFLLSHLGAFSRKTVGALSTPFLKRSPTSPHVPRCPYRTIITSPYSTFPFLMRKPKISGSWGFRAPGTSYLCRLFFFNYTLGNYVRGVLRVSLPLSPSRAMGCSAGISLFFILTPMPNGYGLDRQFLSVERSSTFHIPNLHVSYYHLRSIHPEVCRAPKTGCVRNSQQVHRNTMR